MKKSTTRIAAILIAIVMLIGCSVGVISASASSYYDLGTVNTIKEAMSNYEKKMSSGTIYTNMSNAYEKYVALSRILDQYYYGNSQYNTTLINQAVYELNQATANMTQVFVKKTANNPDALDGSYTKSDLLVNGTVTNENGTFYNVTDEITGVIKTVGLGGDTPYFEITLGDSGVTKPRGTYNVQFGSIVFLDDGSTKMGTPISFFYTRPNTTGTSRPRRCYPQATGFYLDHVWHGNGKSGNNNYDGNPGYKSGTGESMNYMSTGDYPAYGHSNNRNYLSNTLYYRNNQLADTEYVKAITDITFFAEASTGHTGTITLGQNAQNNGTYGQTYVYVVNYKVLLDAINSTSTLIKNVANYKEGGLTNLIKAIDTATAYDPNNDFASVNASNVSTQLSVAANTAKTNIGKMVTDLKTAPTGDSYSDLRTAIDAARAKYFEDTSAGVGVGGTNPTDANGNPKYCPVPWGVFADLYKSAADYGPSGNASAMMYAAGSSGNYNNGEAAKDLARRLNAALANVTEHKADANANWIEIPTGDSKYKKANCTENGLGIEYSHCVNTSCTTNIIVDLNSVIESLGHNKDNCTFTPESSQNCTDEGTPAYWQCTVKGDDLHEDGCGKYFDDNDGEIGAELPEGPKALPKLGHDLRIVNTQREATCQQEGYKENIYQCNQCHNYYLNDDDQDTDQESVSIEYFNNNKISAKPHNQDFTPAETATCEKEGHDAYYFCDMCNHYFSDAEDVSSRKDLGETAPGTYLLAHDFQNYEYNDDKDCITNGTETGKCTMCGTADTRLAEGYEAVGHKFGADSKTERVLPTCIDGGNVEYYTCDECGKKFNTNNEWSVAEVPDNQLNIPATGMHSFVEHAARNATCTEQGYDAYYECSVCTKAFDTDQQTEDDENFDETHGIDLSTWYKDGLHTLITHGAKRATCEEKGYNRYYECAICKRLFDSNDQGSVDNREEFESTHEITNFDGDGDDAWAKLGTHSVKHFPGTVANCVEGGEEDHYECIYCDTWFSDDSGEDDKIITEVQPTEPDPNNHVGLWTYHQESSASCTSEWWTTSCYECLGCGNFYADKDQATTDDALDQSIMNEPVGHNQEGTRETAIVIQDSTCYYEGSQIRYKYCTVCDANQDFVTEAIAMKAHTPKFVDKQDPTCKAEGLGAHYECSVPECGKLFAAEDTTCSGNPITRDSIVIPSVGHDFSVEGTAPVTKATCNTNAIYEYSCSYNCGTSENHEKAGTMTGHNMETHAQKEATCLENGVPATYYSCDICNRNYTDNDKYTTNIYSGYLSSPATGHSFKLVDDNAKAATCHEQGELAYYICENENCELKDAKFLSNADNMAEEGIKSNVELIIAEDMKNHTALAFVTGTPATCEGWKSGMRDHNYCADCGSYYEVSDVNYDTIIKDENVFVLDPTHTLTHHDATPKACLESGKMEHWSCDVCGEIFKDDTTPNVEKGIPESEITIEADGHNFGAYVPADEATCVTPSKAGHVECQDCGIKVICDEANVNTHDVLWYEGDDSEKIDGDINPDNHVNTVNHDPVAATCVVKAVDAYTECKDCGKLFAADGSETTLDALTHDVDLNNHVNVVPVGGTAPKCGVAGVKDHFKCNDCGKEFVDQACTEEATDENLYIEPLEHSFTDYKPHKDATCTDNATEIAECDHGCGTTDERDVAGSATGHDFTDYKSNNNANCTEDGTETAECNHGCGATDERTVEGSATGHDFTDYKSNDDATCTDNGTETAECNHGCGETDTRTEADSAKGHTPGEAKEENRVEPNETTDGGYDLVVHCEVCGETLESTHVTLPATGSGSGEDPSEKPSETPSETPSEQPTEKPGDEPTTQTPAEEDTTKAPSEDTSKNPSEDTTKAPGNGNGSGSNSGTSPNTGLAITIPVFSLAALAGGFFSLGYARKKKNEDEE